jgi:hypothetical protein
LGTEVEVVLLKVDLKVIVVDIVVLEGLVDGVGTTEAAAAGLGRGRGEKNASAAFISRQVLVDGALLEKLFTLASRARAVESLSLAHCGTAGDGHQSYSPDAKTAHSLKLEQNLMLAQKNG